MGEGWGQGMMSCEKRERSERLTNALHVAKSCLNPLAWADLADSPAAVLTV